MNVPVHVFGECMYAFLLDGSTLALCLCSALLDSAKHLSKVVVPIYTPTSHIREFCLLYSHVI